MCLDVSHCFRHGETTRLIVTANMEFVVLDKCRLRSWPYLKHSYLFASDIMKAHLYISAKDHTQVIINQIANEQSEIVALLFFGPAIHDLKIMIQSYHVTIIRNAD